MRGLVLAAVLTATPVAADQCVGAVLLGHCYGSVLRDGYQPENYFDRRGQGYYAAPQPETRIEDDGSFGMYFTPKVMPDGKIGWVEPRRSR